MRINTLHLGTDISSDFATITVYNHLVSPSNAVVRITPTSARPRDSHLGFALAGFDLVNKSQPVTKLIIIRGQLVAVRLEGVTLAERSRELHAYIRAAQQHAGFAVKFN